MRFHSVVSDSAIPWTVAPHAPLSMEFSRQEYWSGEIMEQRQKEQTHPLNGDFLFLGLS